MASIRQEITVALSAEAVWDAVRDAGAVHQRLVPGRVASVRLVADERILVFDGGREIRELILDIDDDARRFAYAVVEGDMLGLTFHHATFEVIAEEPGICRLVWVTDFAPNHLADEVRARLSVGAALMKRTLEGSAGTS